MTTKTNTRVSLALTAAALALGLASSASACDMYTICSVPTGGGGIYASAIGAIGGTGQGGAIATYGQHGSGETGAGFEKVDSLETTADIGVSVDGCENDCGSRWANLRQIGNVKVTGVTYSWAEDPKEANAAVGNMLTNEYFGNLSAVVTDVAPAPSD